MVTKFGKKLTLSDDEFAKRFENQTLKPNMFDHYGHLRLAWIYLNRYDLETASHRMCKSIRNYAAYWNETDKFKEDLTKKIMVLLNERFIIHKTENVDEFIQLNPDIFKDLKNLI